MKTHSQFKIGALSTCCLYQGLGQAVSPQGRDLVQVVLFMGVPTWGGAQAHGQPAQGDQGEEGTLRQTVKVAEGPGP